jgi:hypothetical protein
MGSIYLSAVQKDKQGIKDLGPFLIAVLLSHIIWCALVSDRNPYPDLSSPGNVYVRAWLGHVDPNTAMLGSADVRWRIL